MYHCAYFLLNYVTACLLLECSLSESGHTIEKWNLVDVAHNNTRGSNQRLREKKERITQRSEHFLRDALCSSQQQVKELKEQLQAAEQKAAADDVRIRTARDEESVSVCVCGCVSV